MTYATIPDFKAALDAEIGIESVLTESQGSSHLTYCSPTGWPLFLVEAFQDGDRVWVGGAGAPVLLDRVQEVMRPT
jgi:hypothetical protein